MYLLRTLRVVAKWVTAFLRRRSLECLADAPYMRRTADATAVIAHRCAITDLLNIFCCDHLLRINDLPEPEHDRVRPSFLNSANIQQSAAQVNAKVKSCSPNVHLIFIFPRMGTRP